MFPPPAVATSSDESSRRFVTPVSSFVGSSSSNNNNSCMNIQPFGNIEPNHAPQPSRNIVKVEDLECCQLSDADTFRRQIARGPSLLANNSSFRRSVGSDSSSFRRSITRGVSRYSTDDSLAPLKEEVKVDKSKRRASKKKQVKIVLGSDDDDDDDEKITPPRPVMFGLTRKSSIRRRDAVKADTANTTSSPAKNAPNDGNVWESPQPQNKASVKSVWEGLGSPRSLHTKNTVTTVDVSSSEADNSEEASFADITTSHNEEDFKDGSSSSSGDEASSTEFEEQEELMNEPGLGLPTRNLSFISTASGQSWSLYESYE
jgi:hypothetical protein